eukprot:m.190092 g.190092  ORF g.190092 m.190092 type:complete len:69 (-) comp15638_c0_seq2:2647-2853(-)
MVISKILVGKLKHKRESVELAKEAWKQICKTLDLLETVTPLFDRQIQVRTNSAFSSVILWIVGWQESS